MSGFISVSRITARVKGKVYKVEVKPAKLEVTELKIFTGSDKDGQD